MAWYGKRRSKSTFPFSEVKDKADGIAGIDVPNESRRGTDLLLGDRGGGESTIQQHQNATSSVGRSAHERSPSIHWLSLDDQAHSGQAEFHTSSDDNMAIAYSTTQKIRTDQRHRTVR
jgi:hypothetical protein